MDKLSFVKKYYSLAKIAGAKFNINPVVILAQGAVESGWGDSTNAKVAHNFFGITAFGATNDYWNGDSRQATTGLKFRVYKTDQDSFYDFARLISSKYSAAAKVSFDTNAYAHAIAYSAYIAEQNGDNRPSYESQIKSNSDFIKKVYGPEIFQAEQDLKKKGL